MNIDKNYVAQGLVYVAGQYSESEKYKKWLSVRLRYKQEFRDLCFKLQGMLNIDKATGEMLTRIGEIVGAKRVLDNTTLNDATLRAYIRAMIIRNNCSSTIDDIESALCFIFDSDNITITRTAPMILLITPNDGLNGVDVATLDKYAILPRPTGVWIKYYNTDTGQIFGFEDTVIAEPVGYWDDDSTGVGAGKWKD